MSRSLMFAFATVLIAGCLDDAGEDFDVDESESSLPQGPVVQISTDLGGLCWDMPQQPAGPFMLQQYPCHAGQAQRWSVSAAAAGIPVTIRLANDNFACVDVPNSNIVSGQDLQVAFCNGGNNQKWVLEPNGPFSIIHPVTNSSLCVDIEWAATTIARVQLHSCNGQQNQRFRFRTILKEVTMPACAGDVRVGQLINNGNIINATNVAPGTRVSRPEVNAGSQCMGGPITSVGCPANTNVIILDRAQGAGAFPLVCFRE
ncbi:MAG: RICIN domain-containing protein [Kofleriaceae bacterium]